MQLLQSVANQNANITMVFHSNTSSNITFLKERTNGICNYLFIFIFVSYRTMSMPRSVRCQLCETDIENVIMLRSHLMTRLHLKREQEVGFNGEA